MLYQINGCVPLCPSSELVEQLLKLNVCQVKKLSSREREIALKIFQRIKNPEVAINLSHYEVNDLNSLKLKVNGNFDLIKRNNSFVYSFFRIIKNIFFGRIRSSYIMSEIETVKVMIKKISNDTLNFRNELQKQKFSDLRDLRAVQDLFPIDETSDDELKFTLDPKRPVFRDSDSDFDFDDDGSNDSDIDTSDLFGLRL